MNRELYIFDFGDTLVSYPLNTWDNQLAFITNFLVDFMSKNPELTSRKTPAQLAHELNKENEDGTTLAFAERIIETRFFEPAISEKLALILEKNIVEEACRLADAFPDAIPGVDALRSKGAKTAIMSNLPWGTDSAVWKKEFSRHGFAEGANMDSIVCCVDVGFRKPNPHGLMEIMSRLNVLPEKTVFIGDNPTADREAARRAGCGFIFMDRGHYSLASSDIAVSSLLELL